MAGFIYLIRMGDTSYHKVGVARSDPQDRLADLQVSSPFDLHLIEAYFVDNPIRSEREIHVVLSYCRVRGEWYKDTDGDVIKVFREYGSMALFDVLLDDSEDDITSSVARRKLLDMQVPRKHAAFCKLGNHEVAWSTPSEAGTIKRWGCAECRSKKEEEV